MKMHPVKSSNIAAVGYDEAAKELHVHFANGGQYKYFGVGPEKHTALLKAKSLGAHFGAHIRGGHKFERLDG